MTMTILYTLLGCMGALLLLGISALSEMHAELLRLSQRVRWLKREQQALRRRQDSHAAYHVSCLESGMQATPIASWEHPLTEAAIPREPYTLVEPYKEFST